MMNPSRTDGRSPQTTQARKVSAGETALIAWQNLRLTIGLMLAWLLSALSLLAWIRRLPTLAVLVRRRLRRAVLGQSATHAPPLTHDPTRLWRQDSALPGNRVDGFRFDYLLLMIVITPVYLWLELSFGVNLLDTIGGDASSDQTDAIEHWGRLISGLAVALVFFKSWCEQCEKWDRSLLVHIPVSLVIGVICVALTWIVQDAVIAFYVKRAAAGVQLSLGALVLVVVLCIWAIRSWLHSSMTTRRRGLAATLAGLAVLVALSVLLISRLEPLLSLLTRHTGWADTLVQDLGRERHQAATLTLVRRGIQQQTYVAQGSPVNAESARSAEGKAALALFPIVASGLDQARFADDRPALLQGLMFRDWDQQNGDTTFAAYLGVIDDLRQMHAGPYAEASSTYRDRFARQGRASAEAFWRTRITELLGDEHARPGLTFDVFADEPASRKYLRRTLACLDCEFTAGMTRAAFAGELFTWTQAINVRQMQTMFATPTHFERGHDGEVAARAYWVPIWALLFSMIGAFTHIFKIAFSVTEYMVRRTLQKAQAADSPLAAQLVRNSKVLLGAALLCLALFIYFSDNRVTGTDNYVRLHQRMWSSQPLVGAIASHWTINAQGLIYPFTRKIRPDWLHFEDDPLAWLDTGHEDAE